MNHGNGSKKILFPLQNYKTVEIRTITDLFLARADEMPHRFYSMSAGIRKQRTSYYEILEKTQKGGLDITAWLEWLLDCLEAALLDTEKSVGKILRKSAMRRLSVVFAVIYAVNKSA